MTDQENQMNQENNMPSHEDLEPSRYTEERLKEEQFIYDSDEYHFSRAKNVSIVESLCGGDAAGQTVDA